MLEITALTYRLELSLTPACAFDTSPLFALGVATQWKDATNMKWAGTWEE